MVDAANLAPGSREFGGAIGGMTEAAEYLYDVLLLLQKRYTSAKTSKGPKELPVLIAANKQDLFTAEPAELVIRGLEAELTKIRETRGKGLQGVGADGDGDDEESEWLGEGGDGEFRFRQMEEVNVVVEVKGGNVLGEGPGVGAWWEWIGGQL